jgi:LytS/YehU family sensor histidine kinase
VGLRNVGERLQGRFGNRASLSAEQLASGGFRNTVRLPLRR